MDSTPSRAYVKILEQPAPDRARFRYQCEGYSSLVGVSSTADEKTFPTIQVVGYQGKAVLIVSCVTKDEPYRPHPFNIDGKEGCKKGVCSMHIPPDKMTVELCNIGIKCVKKRGVSDSLRQRQELKIDPFKTGFEMNQCIYDYSAVRLCFQVFLEAAKGKFTIPLAPVVSDPIYDRKNISDLVINKISHCVCRVDEQPEIIMLCGKIQKEDVQIRFYEERDGILIWEGYGSFTPAQIHRQVAICFKAPKYFNLHIDSPVRVQLQLRRSSDGATSMSIPFEFIPSEEIGRKRKIPKMDSLLDLARCFENCTDNPFMNIKTDEAAHRRKPLRQLNDNTPNKFSVNIASNGYTFNIPPRNSGLPQRQSNMSYAHSVQTSPSQHHAQHVIPNIHLMNLPGQEVADTSYNPIPKSVNDVSEIILNNNLSFNINAEEDTQDNTNVLTTLATNVLDDIYRISNHFH